MTDFINTKTKMSDKLTIRLDNLLIDSILLKILWLFQEAFLAKNCVLKMVRRYYDIIECFNIYEHSSCNDTILRPW